MNRIISLIFAAAVLSFRIYAQNVMSVSDVSGNAGDTVEVSININNADQFVAFQTDIQLPAQVQYISGSAELSSRMQGHQVSASLLQNNILRLIVYSFSQTVFTGNSGSVLKFRVKLAAKSGSYSLVFIDPVVSSALSENILTSSVNGNLTIYSPEISLSQSALDFPRTALTNSALLNLTIYNPGNKTLSIKKMYTDNSYFELPGGSSFDIAPNSSSGISVKFNSVVKGNYSAKLFIESNAPEMPLAKVSLSAVAFAVNELHIISASGRSGYPIDVMVKINNMEPFNGFQFDLTLPNVLSYISNSAELTGRKADQTVSASMISPDRLRVIVFSPSNQSFSGNDGDILKLRFNLNGTGGNYYTAAENVIITDITGTNITSAYYSNYVNIMSPDIDGNTNVNMGEVPVTSGGTYSYQLNNNGNDTLIVTSFSAPHEFFWNSTPLPVKINPWSAAIFQLNFKNTVKGTYTDRFAVRSNDPDEDPFYVNVTASSFAPNYMIVEDSKTSAGDTVTIKIDISNYEPFAAFQTDFEIPASLNYVPGSAVLSSRKQDHIIQAALISDNKIRILGFSMTLQPFKDTSGTVAELKFIAGSGTGTFPLQLSSAAISNMQSQNILKSVKNGQIQIIPAGYEIDGTLTYDNNAHTPLANFIIYLKSGITIMDSATTSGTGSFSFRSVKSGNYSLSIKANKPWGGVTSTDALLIRKYIVGQTALTGLRLAAADVNGSRSITSTDALLIRKRIVGLVNSFPIWDWLFEPVELTIENSDLKYNIKAIVAGDTNGSYDPSL